MKAGLTWRAFLLRKQAVETCGGRFRDGIYPALKKWHSLAHKIREGKLGFRDARGRLKEIFQLATLLRPQTPYLIFFFEQNDTVLATGNISWCTYVYPVAFKKKKERS